MVPRLSFEINWADLLEDGELAQHDHHYVATYEERETRQSRVTDEYKEALDIFREAPRQPWPKERLSPTAFLCANLGETKDVIEEEATCASLLESPWQ